MSNQQFPYISPPVEAPKACSLSITITRPQAGPPSIHIQHTTRGIILSGSILSCNVVTTFLSLSFLAVYVRNGLHYYCIGGESHSQDNAQRSRRTCGYLCARCRCTGPSVLSSLLPGVIMPLRSARVR